MVSHHFLCAQLQLLCSGRSLQMQISVWKPVTPDLGLPACWVSLSCLFSFVVCGFFPTPPKSGNAATELFWGSVSVEVNHLSLVRGGEGNYRTRSLTRLLWCALLQSHQPPPVPNTALDGGRPEPESILLVCQAQVAELEQWLDKTKMSLRSDPQGPHRQQMVEPQLADCQVRWWHCCCRPLPWGGECRTALPAASLLLQCTELVTAWLQLCQGLVKTPGFRVGICVHPRGLGRILKYM